MRITPSTFTPRTADTCARVAGCRYAIIANVSIAARDNFDCAPLNKKCSTTSAFSRRVCSRHPSSVSCNSNPLPRSSNSRRSSNNSPTTTSSDTANPTANADTDTGASTTSNTDSNWERTNDTDGNVTFTSSSLIFSKPGRYTFKARELSDNPIANVTYDSSEKEIVVNVTTDENNQLVATQESTPEFVNTYVAPKKPGKLLPWTGDTTSFVAIGALAGASLAAFAAATAIRRKRSE